MSIEICNNNIKVRSFIQADLVDFANYRSIAEVAQYQGWEVSYCLADAQAMFNRMQQHHFGEVGQWFQLAIVDIEANKLMGDLAVHFIDTEQVEIGFTLAPEHQGQGIAQQALSLLLDHLFLVMGKHRITATTDVLNSASNRLLARIGFRQEGHFVDNIFFKGAWGSEYLFALLGSEYKKLHQ